MVGQLEVREPQTNDILDTMTPILDTDGIRSSNDAFYRWLSDIVEESPEGSNTIFQKKNSKYLQTVQSLTFFNQGQNYILSFKNGIW